MLDGQPAVVAHHLQPVAELPPPFLAVTETKRDIGPAASRDVHERAVLQEACCCLNGCVQQRVLGVDVIDRRSQGLSCECLTSAPMVQMS